MFGVILPRCNRMFVAFLGDIKISLKYEKIPLLFSCRAFSLSTPTFSLSTPVDNGEATWKKAKKCNKQCVQLMNLQFTYYHLDDFWMCTKEKNKLV